MHVFAVTVIEDGWSAPPYGSVRVTADADGPATVDLALREYATWDVMSLHAVDGPTPTIILEAIAPGTPSAGYPSIVQVRDDQPRLIATAPTSC